MMNRIHKTYQLGQSFWLDYIRRDLIASGELQQMVNAGEIRGVTSNPTIFEQAIAGSDLYTSALRPLAHAGWTTEAALDSIVIEDIRSATDVFLPLYEDTNGGDGYVSIEVNPLLAQDSDATVSEARRLWTQVNRPNVMVKIPATAQGIPAIEQAVYEGININVTLIFSLDRYAQVIEAYLHGLERRLAEGESLDHIASVASFFVSRVDTAVDGQLEGILRQEGTNAARAAALLGKIAVANAKMAYAQFKAAFESERFGRLIERGAQVQRPLWASTSTKNPAYPDTLYVDELIGAQTVNTLPPKTIDAFRDHGKVELTLEQGFSQARGQIAALEGLGVSMEAVTDQLEREGVASFSKSFESLSATIDERSRNLQGELGPLLPSARLAFDELTNDEVAARIWKRDTELWPGDADFIREQLAWLTFPQSKHQAALDSEKLAAGILADNLNVAVFIAAADTVEPIRALPRPEHKKAIERLMIQDTTSSAEMRRITRKTPIANSLFVISDETGDSHRAATVLDQHWVRASNRLKEGAGRHFVALAPENSALARAAEQRGFRYVSQDSDPIGGEYSALSRKTLLAAALLGLAPTELLDAAAAMAQACRADVVNVSNPGIYLGGVLSALASNGRGNLGILADPEIRPFASWLEKLLNRHLKQARAEILLGPEMLGYLAAEQWGVIYLRREGTHDERIQSLIDRQLPVLVFDVGAAPEEIGAEIYRWQFGLAVAAHRLGENPFKVLQGRQFDQKVRSLAELSIEKGQIPFPKTIWESAGLGIWAAPATQVPKDLEDVAAWLHMEICDSVQLAISSFRLSSKAFDAGLLQLQKELQASTLASHSSKRAGSSGREKLQLILTASELKLSSSSDSLETVEAATALARAQYNTERGWKVYGLSFNTADRAAEFLESLAEQFKAERDKIANA
jgi:transaldolase/glucose-6-phosphate isomerase